MSKKYLDENGLAKIATIVNEKLSQKVDRVSGKQLSTNDYTTAEKTKLAGIATGANNYTLPKASSSVLGGVKVGSNLSINSNGVLSATNTTYGVATQSANGLMSSTDKVKLDDIATEATKNVASTITPKANGTATIGTDSGFARGDHVHPLQTSVSGNAGTATKATQDSSGQQINTTYIKGLSVSGKTITYTKGNGTTGTITTQDTTYGVATQSSDGLMSAEDKEKLDGMAAGTITHGYATIKSGQTLTNGYAVTLPVSYIVGKHQLELYANGERLILKDSSTSDGHYQESGSSGASSTKITFYRTSADGNVTLTSDLVLYAVVKA